MATYVIDGRITKDAELKTFDDGTPVAKFTVAFNRPKKDTHFYNCAIFGERATKLAQYLTRGKAVVCVGEPDWRLWNGKTYETINVDKVSFFGGGKEEELKTPPKGEFCGDDMPFDAGDDIPF